MQMWTEGNWSSKSGKTAFIELLERYPKMDAVFVGNDQMALSVLHTANKLGRKIPDDLSVIGFDGIQESEFYIPSLSTVNQNQNELGCIAVEELVRLVEKKMVDGNEFGPKYRTIQPELIIRQST
jgi:LacI family transcriptional regulator